MLNVHFSSISFESFLHNFPGLAFFKNLKLEYAFLSQAFFQLLGSDSPLNKADFDTPWADYADIYQKADHLVLEYQKPIRFVVPGKVKDQEVIFTDIKFPIKDEQRSIIGLCAQVKMICDRNAVQSLHLLNHLDHEITGSAHFCAAQYIIDDEICNPYHLSKRELQVLFYLIRGVTPKKIAYYFNRTKRTVERHVDNIKIKFNCCATSDVITQAIENHYLKVIPKGWVPQALKLVALHSV